MVNLQRLDLFGVEFSFRTEKYKKFQSKSGGVFFIIYLLLLIGLFFYQIYDYFTSNRFESTTEFISFIDETINLKNMEFNIGFDDFFGIFKEAVVNGLNSFSKGFANIYVFLLIKSQKSCVFLYSSWSETEIGFPILTLIILVLWDNNSEGNFAVLSLGFNLDKK